MRYYGGMTTPRGFTLIEVVVSLFVMTVAVTLAGTMLHVIPLARHSKFEDLALKIAANQIESARSLGYGAAPASGAFADTLLSNLPSGSGVITVTDYNLKTKKITATVSWQESSGTASSSVALTTLVTMVGGLQ